jgi:ankyrin repeat protein
MEIAIMLRRLHGGGFKLEEVMPACFRSSGSATQGAPSGNSIIVQLAEIGFFSVSNNLMHESNIVELLRKSLDADGGRLFKALFKVKSPTVQSFICRLLEGLSSGPSWSYGSSLLRQLESCGLDRNILAGPTGGRCLQLAIWHFNTDIALYLIREGFQIHPKLGPSEPFNQTPVQLATLRHNRVVLDALLGRPSDRIEPQPAQKSHTLERNKAEVALQEAIYENDLEEIKCLLLDGLDVDSAHTDWGDRILDFAFFENRMAYDLMLLHSRALDHLCTVPGIISAANTRERLEAYLDDRIGESNNEIEDHHEDGYEVLQRAVKLAIAFDRMREAKTILDLDWVREGLDLEMLLLEAAQYWRFDIMVELVAWGADVTALNEVRDDQEELLDFALGDADSVKNSYGWITPLQEAIKWASLEVVEFLIDAGALTTHIPPDCSCRALGTAVKQGDAEIVQLLIQRGADVKEFADKRETGLLEFAIESEYCGLDVLNILLEAGASIDGSTGWNTPLTRAILRRRGHEIIYLLLERGADIDRIGVGKWARTPLQAAAQMGDVELTKELLRRGAPVNTGPADDHGRTALQAACEGGRGNEAVILLLLQAGADISAPPALSYGRTALQALCCSENPSSELVALLSDREPGAIYAQPASCGGLTALQGAALMGNMKIVILLIEKLADVNEPPSQQEGRMALDGAAEYGRIDIVQLLLTFGATCMAPGSGYNSAVTFATNNGHFAIADMLKGHSQQSGLAPDRSNAGS